MERSRLPDRRQQISTTINFANLMWTLSVGFDKEKKAREIFIKSNFGGSDLEALVDDGAVLCSLLLQHGISAQELATHLGRQGAEENSKAASLLGVAAARTAELEAEEQKRL